jgi:hypothetical protein
MYGFTMLPFYSYAINYLWMGEEGGGSSYASVSIKLQISSS